MKDEKNINEFLPPKWATRFFRWYCNDYFAEAALGDMEELYGRRRKKMSKLRADLFYLWNAFQFLQPFAVRRKTTSHHLIQSDMLKSYFTIAWRSMSRQKMYTSITIGGFALGLATCMMIGLFIHHEMSYDKNYADGNRIFKFYNEYDGTNRDKWASIPPPVAGILKSEFPEVEKVARITEIGVIGGGNSLFRREDQIEDNYEEGFVYADPDLLEILEIPMIYGKSKDALSRPYTMAVSKRVADRYFPNENPIGKVVIMNEDKNKPYTIGGVMQNRPVTSHFQYDFIITLKDVEFWPGEQTSWCCWNYNTYVKLRQGADARQLEEKFSSMRDRYYVSYLQKMGDQSADSVRKHHHFRLQSVGSIYLEPNGIYDLHRHGDMLYIWIFGGIAVFILVLACINFINLSTARSANRAKEVGLRKAVGSTRGSLITQFLSESVVCSLLSFILAGLIVILSLPLFSKVADKALSIPWTTWWLVPMMLLAAVAVGVLAGLYPSFYLSRFQAVDVLKGSVSRGSKRPMMRSLLVVFQFSTSVILIVGTLVVNRQMKFILNAKTGFDKDQVVLLQGTNTLGAQRLTFKNELLALSDVENVSVSSYLPVEGTNREGYGYYREGREQLDAGVNAQKWRVDEDYIKTLRMKIVEGRDFLKDVASEKNSTIINQAMARSMGFKNPVGERISNGNEKFTVIGVVEDFNFESLKGRVQPLSFVLQGGSESIMTIRIRGAHTNDAIGAIGQVWKKFLPNQPMQYSFLDQRFAKMYDDVQRMGTLFAVFAVLAIIVACLGLFALSAFMIEQRNKEISIRLVMGASMNSIFGLLTGNFMKLVLIALVIATPLSWLLAKQWLQRYSYQTTITWDLFFFSGIITVVIALFTISYQSLRAARENPAARLRAE